MARASLVKAVLLATASSVALSSVAIAEDINTMPFWNGTTFISSWGVPNTATYGQTITPNNTQRNLRSFTFNLALQSGVAPQFQAFVYAWDGTRALGPALFSSAIMTAPTTATPSTYSMVTISTGTSGVVLVPGTQYVLFLTTSTVSGQANGTYRYGALTNNTTYPGGEFVFFNNGTDFAQLLSANWSRIAEDLAFIALFSPLLRGTSQNEQAVANAINGLFDSGAALAGDFYALSDSDLPSLEGQISTAAVTSGLHSAGLFLDVISDPFITEGGASQPSGPNENAYAPAAYNDASAMLSSPGALAALGADVSTTSESANKALMTMSGTHSADPVDTAFDARWKMWGTAYGGRQDIRGNAIVGSNDVTTSTWGVATGFDTRLADSRVGFSLGGAGTTFSLAGGLGSGSAGIFNLGVYGSKNFGDAYVTGALAYGWNNVRTTRTVGADTLTANFNAHTLAARVEGGYKFGFGSSAITPYVAAQGASYMLPSYTETSALGGPFALAYGRQTEAMFRTELGARLEYSIPMTSGSVKLTGRAAWAYNAITARAVTASFQGLGAQSFTINGAQPSRHSFLLDAGAEFTLNSGLSAKVGFNGEFSNNVRAYGASAKITYRW